MQFHLFIFAFTYLVNSFIFKDIFSLNVVETIQFSNNTDFYISRHPRAIQSRSCNPFIWGGDRRNSYLFHGDHSTLWDRPQFFPTWLLTCILSPTGELDSSGATCGCQTWTTSATLSTDQINHLARLDPREAGGRLVQKADAHNVSKVDEDLEHLQGPSTATDTKATSSCAALSPQNYSALI